MSKNDKKIRKTDKQPSQRKALAKSAESKTDHSPVRALGIPAHRTTFYVICALVLAFGIFMLVPRAINNQTQAVQQQQTTITYQGVDGKSALDLLKSSHTVDAKHYDFGDYVTGIDGRSAASDEYWAFYVNGQLSSVGADKYITKNSDTIQWKLDKVQ